MWKATPWRLVTVLFTLFVMLSPTESANTHDSDRTQRTIYSPSSTQGSNTTATSGSHPWANAAFSRSARHYSVVVETNSSESSSGVLAINNLPLPVINPLDAAAMCVYPLESQLENITGNINAVGQLFGMSEEGATPRLEQVTYMRTTRTDSSNSSAYLLSVDDRRVQTEHYFHQNSTSTTLYTGVRFDGTSSQLHAVVDISQTELDLNPINYEDGEKEKSSEAEEDESDEGPPKFEATIGFGLRATPKTSFGPLLLLTDYVLVEGHRGRLGHIVERLAAYLEARRLHLNKDSNTASAESSLPSLAGLRIYGAIAIDADANKLLWITKTNPQSTTVERVVTLDAHDALDGEWHHVALVLNEKMASIQLYVDGRTETMRGSGWRECLTAASHPAGIPQKGSYNNESDTDPFEPFTAPSVHNVSGLVDGGVAIFGGATNISLFNVQFHRLALSQRSVIDLGAPWMVENLGINKDEGMYSFYALCALGGTLFVISLIFTYYEVVLKPKKGMANKTEIEIAMKAGKFGSRAVAQAKSATSTANGLQKASSRAMARDSITADAQVNKEIFRRLTVLLPVFFFVTQSFSVLMRSWSWPRAFASIMRQVLFLISFDFLVPEVKVPPYVALFIQLVVVAVCVPLFMRLSRTDEKTFRTQLHRFKCLIATQEILVFEQLVSAATAVKEPVDEAVFQKASRTIIEEGRAINTVELIGSGISQPVAEEAIESGTDLPSNAVSCIGLIFARRCGLSLSIAEDTDIFSNQLFSADFLSMRRAQLHAMCNATFKEVLTENHLDYFLKLLHLLMKEDFAGIANEGFDAEGAKLHDDKVSSGIPPPRTRRYSMANVDALPPSSSSATLLTAVGPTTTEVDDEELEVVELETPTSTKNTAMTQPFTTSKQGQENDNNPFMSDGSGEKNNTEEECRDTPEKQDEVCLDDLLQRVDFNATASKKPSVAVALKAEKWSNALHAMFQSLMFHQPHRLPSPPETGECAAAHYRIVLEDHNRVKWLVCEDSDVHRRQKRSFLRAANELQMNTSLKYGFMVPSLTVIRGTNVEKGTRYSLKEVLPVRRFDDAAAADEDPLNIVGMKESTGDEKNDLSRNKKSAETIASWGRMSFIGVVAETGESLKLGVYSCKYRSGLRCPQHGTFLVEANEDRHYAVRLPNSTNPYNCCHKGSLLYKYVRDGRNATDLTACSNEQLLVCSHDDCCFAMCATCADSEGLLAYTISAVATSLYNLKHSTTDIAPLVLFLVVQSLLLPITKTTVLILGCHPMYQCEFGGKCYDEPNANFLTSAVVSFVLLVGFRCGVCFLWSKLIRERGKLLKTVGVTNKATWNRILAGDSTVLSTIYRKYELEFMGFEPFYMLFMQLGLSLFTTLLEADSFEQYISVVALESANGVFLAFTNPFMDPVMDSLAKIGNVHQLVQLGFMGFHRAELVDSATAATVVPFMFGVAGLYFVITVVIIYKSIVGPYREARRQYTARMIFRKELRCLDETDTRRRRKMFERVLEEKIEFFGPDHLEVAITGGHMKHTGCIANDIMVDESGAQICENSFKIFAQTLQRLAKELEHETEDTLGLNSDAFDRVEILALAAVGSCGPSTISTTTADQTPAAEVLKKFDAAPPGLAPQTTADVMANLLHIIESSRSADSPFAAASSNCAMIFAVMNGHVVSNKDFSGCYFVKAAFDNTCFVNVDFTGSFLRQCDFTSCYFDRCTFTDADINLAKFGQEVIRPARIATKFDPPMDLDGEVHFDSTGQYLVVVDTDKNGVVVVHSVTTETIQTIDLNGAATTTLSNGESDTLTVASPHENIVGAPLFISAGSRHIGFLSRRQEDNGHSIIQFIAMDPDTERAIDMSMGQPEKDTTHASAPNPLVKEKDTDDDQQPAASRQSHHFEIHCGVEGVVAASMSYDGLIAMVCTHNVRAAQHRRSLGFIAPTRRSSHDGGAPLLHKTTSDAAPRGNSFEPNSQNDSYSQIEISDLCDSSSAPQSPTFGSPGAMMRSGTLSSRQCIAFARVDVACRRNHYDDAVLNPIEIPLPADTVPNQATNPDLLTFEDITAFHLSRDGNSVVLVEAASRLHLWSTNDGHIIYRAITGVTTTESIDYAAFSPDSTKLVLGSAKRAKVASATTGEVLLQVGGYLPIDCVTFTNDSRFLLCAGAEAIISYDSTTGHGVGYYDIDDRHASTHATPFAKANTTPKSIVQGLSASQGSRDQAGFIAASSGSRILVVDPTVKSHDPSIGMCTAIAISPDHRFTATGWLDGDVSVCSANCGFVVHDVQSAFQSRITCVLFIDNTSFVACGGRTAAIWRGTACGDVATNEPAATTENHGTAIVHVSTTNNSTASIQFTKTASLTVPASIEDLAVSASRNLVAIGCLDGSIRLVNAKDLTSPRSATASSKVYNSAAAGTLMPSYQLPDRTSVAESNATGGLGISASGIPPPTETSPAKKLELDFTPNGQFLIVSAEDCHVIVLEVGAVEKVKASALLTPVEMANDDAYLSRPGIISNTSLWCTNVNSGALEKLEYQFEAKKFIVTGEATVSAGGEDGAGGPALRWVEENYLFDHSYNDNAVYVTDLSSMTLVAKLDGFKSEDIIRDTGLIVASRSLSESTSTTAAMPTTTSDDEDVAVVVIGGTFGVRVFRFESTPQSLKAGNSVNVNDIQSAELLWSSTQKRYFTECVDQPQC